MSVPLAPSRVKPPGSAPTGGLPVAEKPAVALTKVRPVGIGSVRTPPYTVVWAGTVTPTV